MRRDEVVVCGCVVIVPAVELILLTRPGQKLSPHFVQPNLHHTSSKDRARLRVMVPEFQVVHNGKIRAPKNEFDVF